MRLLLRAVFGVLLTALVVYPFLLKHAASEKLPVGLFPLGIRMTDQGGDLSDGWATGHDDAHRGWLVTWAHLPGGWVQGQTDEMGERALMALEATDARATGHKETDRRGGTKQSHKAILKHLTLQGERTLSAIQLQWNCYDGQRAISVIAWAPTAELLSIQDPEGFLKSMSCHHDGKKSTAAPMPQVPLPGDFRLADSRVGEQIWSRVGNESVALRSGVRWLPDRMPTLEDFDLDRGSLYFQFMPIWPSETESLRLPQLPHPVWQMTHEGSSSAVDLAYVWFCPFHRKLISVAWHSPQQRRTSFYDETPVAAPEFLRQVRCPMGCKGSAS